MSTFTSALVAISSILFVALGLWHRYGVLLGSNQCSMTYSHREKETIKVDSVIPVRSGAVLYRYGKPIKSKRMQLKPFPVLFVHGHLGNVDQARSIASFMHNEGKSLEYFSLSFSDTSIAFHASTVLNQAVFLNDAIKKIQSLYLKDGLSSPPKIIVAAHSMGGIVARTAVLINNYPQDCPLSDIIMLSSPITRAPLSVDASLEGLFQSVNKVWQQSLDNTSLPCRKAFAGIDGDDGTGSSFFINTACSLCVPYTRLVSFSGGLYDLQVPPTLTIIDHELVPAPDNVTAFSQQSAKRPGSTITGLMSWYSRILYAPVSFVNSIVGLFTRSSPVSTNDINGSSGTPRVNISTTSNITCSIDSGGNCTAVESSETAASADETSKDNVAPANSATEVNATTSTPQRPKLFRSFAAITMKDWKEQMKPRVDPNYLSIRTSQLNGVGFQIDHNAILWCKEFVEVIVNGIQMLATIAPGNAIDAPVIWEKVFPVTVSNETRYSEVDYGDYIPPVREYIRRLVNNLRWKDMHTVERQQIIDAATGGGLGLVGRIPALVSTMAYEYVTFGYWRVLACYLIIACLVHVAPMVRQLAGYDISEVAVSVLSASHPSYHTHWEILVPATQYWCAQWVPVELAGKTTFSLTQIALVLVLLKVILDSMFLMTQDNLLDSYGNIIAWVASYISAMIVRLIAWVCVVALKLIVQAVGAPFYYLLWKPKFIRKSLKRLFKYGALEQSVLRTYLLSFFIIASIVFGFTGSARVAAHSSSVYLAHVTLATLVIIVFGLVALLLAAPALSSKGVSQATLRANQASYINLAILYLPALLLVQPSASFTLQYLANGAIGGGSHFKVLASFAAPAAIPLYARFTPEMLNYIVIMWAIAFHLLCAYKAGSASASRIVPVPFISEFVGPSVTNIRANDVAGAKVSKQSEKEITGNDTPCLHEDGGRSAIFEKMNDPSLAQSINGVLVGCTYVVKSCKCSVDLKEPTEWCEYCLCRRCGGKNLPAWYDRYTTNNPESSDSSDDAAWEASLLDLLQVFLVLLVAIACAVFAADRFYRYFYLSGAVAVIASLRHIISLGRWKSLLG